MIVDDGDTIAPQGDTCTARDPHTVCQRCGHSMLVVFTNTFGEAVRFACGCVQASLTYRDIMRVHGSRTSELVLSACFAAWGERGAALVPESMKGGLQ